MTGRAAKRAKVARRNFALGAQDAARTGAAREADVAGVAPFPRRQMKQR